MVSAPGPKYSTILFVPPFTVSKPQRYRITSFGEAQPFNLPVKPHTDQFRMEDFPRQPGHHFSGIRTTDTDRQSTQAAAIRRMRVRPDDQAAGKCIIFQHDLMNDPGSRLPEPNAIFFRGGSEEVIHFLVLIHGAKQVFF